MIIKSLHGNYEVFFENFDDFLKKNYSKGDILIVDEFFQSQVDYDKIVVKSSEKSKEFSNLMTIIEKLLSHGFKKNNKIFALGGGVIQDISGFIASILFRGVEWIFIPTTLISQGDSCIGGKTSINFNNLKNQIGTNYPPKKICIDTNFLKTLPDQEIKSGLGEMLHYFIYSSVDDYIFFKNHFKSNEYINLIKKSLEIKKQVVEVDEHEKNIRKLFNYGHTFGHALESEFKYKIPHGICVAKGMDISNFISYKMNFLSKNEYIEMKKILEQIYKNFDFSELNLENYYEVLKKDKKNSQNFIKPILIKEIGKLFQHEFVFDGDLPYILKEYFKNE